MQLTAAAVTPPAEHAARRPAGAAGAAAADAGVRQTKRESPLLPYYPGRLPNKPAPKPGESMHFTVPGLPPYKDRHFSIRNSRHRIHQRFLDLRLVAAKAMLGKAPYRGPIRLDFAMRAPTLEARRNLNDYLGGVMDSLGGSHGFSFTFLPIIYEDDCQIYSGYNRWIPARQPSYGIRVCFLDHIPVV